MASLATVRLQKTLQILSTGTVSNVSLGHVNGGSYLSDAHGINNAVTHSWPTGELSTSFEECVEFKILNYSAWWKGHPYTYGPPVLVYDDDTAGGPNHPSCN